MKTKREIPVWQVIVGVAATLVLVGLLYAHGGTGEASKEELSTMRKAQENRPLVIPHYNGEEGANLSR